VRRALAHATLALTVLLWPADGGRLLAAPSPAAPTLERVDDGLAVAPLLQQVQERLAALDQRERELAERERSLADLSAETGRALDALETLRGTVEQRLATLAALRGDGVARLARMYAAMPPARAAAAREKLEPEVAAAVVGRMRDKRSAAVLASMAPESALRAARATALPLPIRPGDEAASGDPAVPSPARLVR